MNPKVSVIIQFLNSARYLEEAVRSVLWQTFSDWELVLVDGGSTDASVEIAQTFVNRLPEVVRLYRYSSDGTLDIFRSRLWGAKEARAPVLAHLDSDDEWHPRFLERQYSIYDTVFNSVAGLLYGPMVYWWQEPERAEEAYVQPTPPPGLYRPPSLLLEMIRDSYSKSPGNSSVMMARSILIDAEHLAEVVQDRITEDQYLWSFVTLRYPVFVNPEPLVRYRQWSGSACAEAIRMGQHHGQRKRHLNWLFQYIERDFSGSEKTQLLQSIAFELKGTP